jgi:hypothetical protein
MLGVEKFPFHFYQGIREQIATRTNLSPKKWAGGDADARFNGSFRVRSNNPKRAAPKKLAANVIVDSWA